jgi:hypothetical protein
MQDLVSHATIVIKLSHKLCRRHEPFGNPTLFCGLTRRQGLRFTRRTQLPAIKLRNCGNALSNHTTIDGDGVGGAGKNWTCVPRNNKPICFQLSFCQRLRRRVRGSSGCMSVVERLTDFARMRPGVRVCDPNRTCRDWIIRSSGFGFQGGSQAD